MKAIRIILVIILFVPTAYASEWGAILQGMSDGLNKGIENARKIEEMEMMRERRRIMEEERRALEAARQAREEERKWLQEREIKIANFYSYLDDNVPDWRVIDNDPTFVEWLNEEGKMQALHAYARDLNAHSVANIFNEYKSYLQIQKSSPTIFNPNDVKLIKRGGVYEVPVVLNNVLYLYLILDSGAADVSISPDVALTLIKTKTIRKQDWLKGAHYKFADGSTAKSERFNLRSLKIGNMELKNVTCSISNSIDAPMLLGQSALKKLGKYSIDYKKNILSVNTELDSNVNYTPPVRKNVLE
ncbi:MAG: hypothetical protein GX155_03920 [Smithella sp.]|jgi:aspartyl protease family protein|nr:hypothetical protein [Smithella sp.]